MARLKAHATAAKHGGKRPLKAHPDPAAKATAKKPKKPKGAGRTKKLSAPQTGKDGKTANKSGQKKDKAESEPIVQNRRKWRFQKKRLHEEFRRSSKKQALPNAHMIKMIREVQLNENHCPHTYKSVTRLTDMASKTIHAVVEDIVVNGLSAIGPELMLNGKGKTITGKLVMSAERIHARMNPSAYMNSPE